MSKPLIEICALSKMYRLFRRPRHRIMDLLGLPIPRNSYNEFWALRDISLTIAPGERLGIIGRNGAGKSTLLKIVAGLLQPTEGSVVVRGQIQALMDLGTGFHPEFTGRQNVYVALSYRGITGSEARRCFEEVVEFTELEEFIDNPLKTYSTGMHARLAFAVATSMAPGILIIDEVLGAGDAYFFNKSSERMRQLVESGASILLVTHALDQITRFCKQAIWLDRGRIVRSGPSLEVVKAYQQYVRVLEDRRLQAKNYKVRSTHYRPEQYDLYSDSLVVRFEWRGQPEAGCDIDAITLWKNDQVEEVLRVGDAQDSDITQTTFVILEGSHWSAPHKTERGFCRRLVVGSPDASWVAGGVVFVFYALFNEADYTIEASYRCHASGQLTLQVWKNGTLQNCRDLPTDRSDWTTQRLPVKRPAQAMPPTPEITGPEVVSTQTDVKHWPGEGSLRITTVALLDGDERPCTVFEVNACFILRVELQAVRSDTYRLLPVAVIYRLDGTNITSQIGDWLELDLSQDVTYRATLRLDPLNLGNGSYVVSVALYKTLDVYLHEPPTVYDWIDRSFEFQVVGTPPAINSVFLHPSEWKIQ